MKVKDIIESNVSLANPKLNFMVTPIGKNDIYYHGDGSYLREEVAEMQMVKWLIDKNKFVILVERNEEFENKRKAFWENNT